MERHQLSSKRSGSRREKIAITLPAKVAAAVRDEVKAKHAPSVSAFITRAVEDKLETDRLQAVLDEMDAEYGALSEADREWARQILAG